MANLRRFLLRRLITFVPTVIGVTFLVYIIAVQIPANPARLWAGGEKADPEVVQRLIEEYHLNDPWYVQYYFFLKKVLSGEAVSPVTHTNVWDQIMEKLLTVTLPLTLFAFLFIITIGIPLGIIAAIKRDTWIDVVIRAFALIGISTPIFWLAYLLIFVLQPRGLISLTGFPMPDYRITGIPILDAFLKMDIEYIVLFIKRMWLPAFMLAYGGIGFITRIVRNSFLDAFSGEYINFMEARGFPRGRIYIHVLRNALTPVVTVLGLMFGGLLAGAPITETVFNLPGLGTYMIRAIHNFDYIVLIAAVLFIALIYVTINLIIDILYAIIDPRVRY
ncbi:ABC transporter permease [Hyperthermus butylicus]|uniref:ABC-type dipeptide/oligopeptide transport system, permease n=1 Tax=Hyperthermus butylicus (strain DSM 5456 / JCM 9403 / PLM1-5) TaxID=415426 RepID=A2BKF6_HYPBU|nr:ABC transporter permease [Hyperthermus butylicus]ABM80467.1 ABC-type dipeptide/oligopeptide transport system, permease [Hyperthermus butylicus DSM 5456]